MHNKAIENLKTKMSFQTPIHVSELAGNFKFEENKSIRITSSFPCMSTDKFLLQSPLEHRDAEG